VSGGERKGGVWLWRDGEGALRARESYRRAGFFNEVEQRFELDQSELVRTSWTRGGTTQGPAAEQYSASEGYVTPADRGPPAPAGALYLPFALGPAAQSVLLDALLKSPGKSLRLHPTGTARLVELSSVNVTNGTETRHVTAYAIEGLGFSPAIVWADRNEYFGQVGAVSVLPKGWETVADQLKAKTEEARALRSEAAIDTLAPRLSGPLLFRNVRMFDSERGRFLEDMSVLVDQGRIAAVGPFIPAPPSARVVDGIGKTLLPGMWDSHFHYGNVDTGQRLLSQGITYVRDPGSDADTSPKLRASIASGKVLGPKIIASMLIDGRGREATSNGVLVSSPEEAEAAVVKAKDLGFFGVKLYGSLDPALVPVIARAADRAGLYLHGHIQRGMRPSDAVRAGYDEITHINWVMMEGMPQSVIDKSSGLERFYGPYRYGPALDFRAEPMNGFLATLAKKKIVVDPTLVVFESDFISRDQLPTELAPFAGRLPPLVERNARGPDIAPTAEVPVEQIRKGFGKWQSLVKELSDRGVPIVAGTDGTGLGLIRELELYVAAGLTPEQALRTATIVPATLYKHGDETGSIRVGKLADLVLVDGDPSKEIGSLRNVDLVLHGGRIMKADDLLLASGMRGRAK
jgi:imidazolonepropionase-like amidohydrolase